MLAGAKRDAAWKRKPEISNKKGKGKGKGGYVTLRDGSPIHVSFLSM